MQRLSREPNGFFATEGGLEYPAVLGLAAAAFTIGGSGPYSLDALTGHVLDRPWMRVTALAVIPAAIGACDALVRSRRRDVPPSFAARERCVRVRGRFPTHRTVILPLGPEHGKV